MNQHPTPLWHPTTDGVTRYRETRLPLEPHEYHVIELPSLETVLVIVIANGEVVYKGAGPVKVYRSPSPL
ncbi:hypothetical protein ACFJGX_05475 [Hydrogenophaga sp. UC242_50]|uniref:hypothetical protein n=1 Tax=unclassified Hydrogenophaga TaxID=2610897 RepID=UPI0036D43ED3